MKQPRSERSDTFYFDICWLSSISAFEYYGLCYDFIYCRQSTVNNAILQYRIVCSLGCEHYDTYFILTKIPYNFPIRCGIVYVCTLFAKYFTTILQKYSYNSIGEYKITAGQTLNFDCLPIFCFDSFCAIVGHCEMFTIVIVSSISFQALVTSMVTLVTLDSMPLIFE